MIKVALVGAGFMGGMHSACYQAVEGAELAWVVDTDADRAAKLAGRHEARPTVDLDEALADPAVSLVDVCLPTDQHPENVIRACRAGKNVICEKPIALTLAEADRMIAAARENRVRFMVAMVIRFWPAYQRLTEIYRSGELGKLQALTLQRVSSLPTWTWKDWILDRKRSGGAVLDMHIHDTDFAYHLLGLPRQIESRLAPTNHGFIYSVFSYPGTTVMIEGGWHEARSCPFFSAYEAVFEKGVVSYDTRLVPDFTIYREDRKENPVLPSRKGGGDSGGNISDLGGYYNEIAYLIDCLERGREPELASAQSARESLALLLQELEQAGL
ncbi:MAG TPA: Gfo/Idh/MocA family oxidoreductase [bacterium]|uniref:1,5-anhydro-D-fructose reductase n=1 Tax=candidate division TA06 bacterium ADurb.Bin417 TaxID=1852828 RepID=A0A1V5MFM0_UNCT6|nr:MAG: 1,5-anhydro-D-fructose reductase [candidate division TA06 bacterium ADurb.Bin417]HNQ34950.1 Gfo/Idh/MocA family oxidoreductase [bacterium]HNS48118.1 Gfo/Idh/MocA family oxidoreductase [bacterium]